MPIAFTCPFCGAQTNVDDRFAGQSGPCAHCGRTITIPAPGAAPTGMSGGSKALLIIVLVVVGFFALLVCGGILAGLLLPAINATRETARSAQCANNMKQIGMAMITYESAKGRFPPAYTVDKNGKRLHSWRVLLLPYLDRPDLYSQVKLDEPWDSPHNQAVAAQMPEVYRCPSNAKLGPAETPYVVVVGPHTLFAGKDSRRSADARDGVSNSLLMTEQRAGVNWMEPKDLEFEQMSLQINDPREPSIGSFHPRGANAMTADGAVHRLPQNADQATMKRLLLIDDGEPLDWSSLENY